MEKLNQETTVGPPEVAGWEEEPRDGPAVLVVHAGMLDEGIGLIGGWIRLDRSLPHVADQIGRIVGREGNLDSYVVVDQLGLGIVMSDQQEVAGLLALARDHGRV